MDSQRFSRQEQLFGEKGQKKISASCVSIVGIGGLGTHVVQQLSLLGVEHLILIDNEELDKTNTNRYIGARYTDPIPGKLKTDIGERIAHEINPDIKVEMVQDSVVSKEAFKFIKKSNYVFGCLDNDGARFILNELCSAYSIPYFDIATDILPENPSKYGGRVCVAWDGHGCLYCYDEIDQTVVSQYLENSLEKQLRQDLYGISKDLLGETGPSVVSINGVVASIGVTEFMLGVTGIRKPKGLSTYWGNRGIVTIQATDSYIPHKDCYYCGSLRGKRDEANIERYLRIDIGDYE